MSYYMSYYMSGRNEFEGQSTLTFCKPLFLLILSDFTRVAGLYTV